MSDPQAELKRMVEELRAISMVLDTMSTPELVRPNLPYKQVTEELVYWAIRVYAYSIFSQFREMLRSALYVYEADHVPVVFHCARAMWEMAAHAYYVKKHCFQYLDQKDWQKSWDLMLGVNQGSRYMKEKQNEARPAANAAAVTDTVPEGPHIARVMKCFNEYFAGEDNRATSNYSFLSEFCHPNSFAFTNHIDMEKAAAHTAGVKVVFLKPDKEACIQVMPDILFSCMPLLFSMDALLRRTGDDGLSKAAHAFARISGPPESERANVRDKKPT